MKPKEEGLFNSDFLKWAWEKVHGKYRQPDQTLHGGPADAASAAHDGTAPAGSLKARMSAFYGTIGTVTGPVAGPNDPGLASTPAGAGQPVTGIGFGGSSISTYMQALAQAQQNAIYQKAWCALQNTMPGVAYTAYGLPTQVVSIVQGGTGAIGMSGANSWTRLTHPSAPIKHEGIRLGEITAWRCWRVDGGFLGAMFVDAIWAPGEPMKGIVGEGLSSGVHAWNSERGSIQYGTDFIKADQFSMLVFGRVALWGEIIEFEEGYRAEYGRVIALDYRANFRGGFFAPADNDLEALRERYGVKGK